MTGDERIQAYVNEKRPAVQSYYKSSLVPLSRTERIKEWYAGVKRALEDLHSAIRRRPPKTRVMMDKCGPEGAEYVFAMVYDPNPMRFKVEVDEEITFG